MAVPVEFCEPWTTPDKLCCPDVVGVDCETGEEVPSTYVWSDEELIEAATSILFKATCRLYPGYCTVVVRPCVGCECGKSPCGCGVYPFIDLQERYPIVSIDEVRRNDEVIPPSEYRLDDYHRLVLLNGRCWPRCVDLLAAPGEDGFFQVTYTAGRQPPIQLRMAAAELACEMKRACNGGDCAFPSNVRSVTRQGVTLNIEALQAAVGQFGSGLAFVDSIVRQYDCRQNRSRVYHPSIGKPRQVYPT